MCRIGLWIELGLWIIIVLLSDLGGGKLWVLLLEPWEDGKVETGPCFSVFCGPLFVFYD